MASGLICDRLVGRDRDVNAIFRLANKGVNVVVIGEHGVGKTSVLEAVNEKFANGKHPDRKLVSFKSYGTKRDLDETLFAASVRHGDVLVPGLKEQTYEKHKQGNAAELERKVLAAVRSSSEPYLLFLDSVERLEKSTFHFFQNILETGKASIVATVKKESLSNSTVDAFFKGFERYELRGLSDSKIGELFEYLAERNGIEISDEDKAEIKSKLPRIAFGKPLAVIQKLERALKEKKLDKDALLEEYPTTTTKYVYYGNASAILLVMALAYRYFLRVTGEPADIVLGGILLAISYGLFRALRLFS